LFPEAQRDRLDVVLVSPRNPLNIGAAARAMANFGFERLSVVAPYEAHWRGARSAIGAPDLLQNAKETASLAEAIAACTLVIGTGTLTARKPEQQTALLPSLAPLVQSELERGGRIALVFGPEKRGLTRDDLSQCHLLVEIPTDRRQPSMNLGQAVAVCLYELATRVFLSDQISVELRPQSGETNVTAETLDLLGEVIEKTMTAAGYSPPEMEAANRHDLRLLLRRVNLNPADAKRALGVFRRILWRLERGRP
jgi:TrmH family RNA methyltransferase